MVSWAFSASLSSCGAHYCCPFRLSFHSQQLSPPSVHVPNYTFQHAAFLDNRGSVIQAEWGRAVAQTRPAVLTLPCCPQTIHCILLKSFERPGLSQLTSPVLCGEAFLREGTFPHLQLPTRVAGPIFYSSSSFFFLSSYQVVREFLLLFWESKSSASLQQVLCENRSICRCILDVPVRRDEFHVLLFHHLDFSPSNYFGTLALVLINQALNKKAGHKDSA